MERKLSEFIAVLRQHHLPVSTAESLDAMSALALVGYGDRLQLYNALAAVLCKHNEHLPVYERCFNRFFAFDERAAEPKSPALANPEKNAGPDIKDAASDNGDGALPGQRPFESLQEWLDQSSHGDNQLLQSLVQGDRALRDTLLAQAATEVDLDTIQVLTQIGPLTQKLLQQAGVDAIDELLRQFQQANDPLSMELSQVRDQLRGAAHEYVERAYLLHGEQASKRLREDNISRTKLNWLSPTEVSDMEHLIRKLARKLAGRYNRRKRTFRRGQLDVSRTLYRNIGHDGVPFYTRWKQTKKERPDIYVICDVSGSVAPFARFLLTFLYSLSDVLPRVRSFAFSSELYEVSERFVDLPANDAISQILADAGGGVTRYGGALDTFKSICGNSLSRHSTIIILGDARNNYGIANVEALRDLYHRVGRVLWFNPEGRHNWNTGDSVMYSYQTACHQAYECGSLKQLERAVDQLLKNIC